MQSKNNVLFNNSLQLWVNKCGMCLALKLKYNIMWCFIFPQDLSHATIEMYTSIGRIRSSKFVGKDLAEFYM